jgi:hypothetical protein
MNQGYQAERSYSPIRAEFAWKPELMADAAADYIACRAGGRRRANAHPLVDEMIYSDVRLGELAIQISKSRGDYRARSGAVTTSDLAPVLANSAQILTGQAYDTAADFLRITRPLEMGNYLENEFPQVDADLESDQPTNEHGEPQQILIKISGGLKARVTRWLRTVGFSEEAIVNDDLNAFGMFFSQVGALGARRAAKSVFGLLVSNPVLGDSRELFNTTDGNLASSGAAPTVDLIGQGMAVLRNQKTLAGNAANNVARYLVVSPAQESNALVLVRSMSIDSPRLDVMTDSQLTGTAWYLLADPKIAPVIGFLRLRGGQLTKITPVRLSTGFAGIGLEIDVAHGVVALSRVGAYKNPGA